jgi:hypothetical protein
MTNTDRLAQLHAFLYEHSGTVSNVLETYARDMHAEADKAMAAYDGIKDDSVKRAIQDKTMITSEGLRMAGEMMREAAQRAEAAWDALQVLEEGEDA